MTYEQKQRRHKVTFFGWDELFLNSQTIFVSIFTGFFMGFLLWSELEYGLAEYIWSLLF